jgi:hypothetical protein
MFRLENSPRPARTPMTRWSAGSSTPPSCWLLGRETAAAMREIADADAAVIFVQPHTGETLAGHSAAAPRRRVLAQSRAAGAGGWASVEGVGHESDGARLAVVVGTRPPIGRITATPPHDRGDRPSGLRPLRRARRPSPPPSSRQNDRSNRCCRVSSSRPIDAARGGADSAAPGQRPHRAITGRAARARARRARDSHRIAPKRRRVPPYNCTTTTRGLADSQSSATGGQLHRGGERSAGAHSRRGRRHAVSRRDWRRAARRQPKLLRFLEQGEIMPVGETRPQRVDVRVLAATNADLEQRVAEGKFREDLYYRLSVIRLQIPPLRERREDIPHLSSLFVREASERLGKPDVNLSSETLELFAQYWWPGNVRQLRNEVQRAVAMSAPAARFGREPLTRNVGARVATRRCVSAQAFRARVAASLAAAVDDPA